MYLCELSGDCRHLSGDPAFLSLMRSAIFMRPSNQINFIWDSGQHFRVIQGCIATSNSEHRFAVRVPISEYYDGRSGWCKVYESLKHLKRSSMFFVNTDFYPKSLGIGGRFVDSHIMEWVDGQKLSSYVEEQCKRNNVGNLRSLLNNLWTMFSALQFDQVAHGDLHPDNVIVGPDGAVKLVDYDTLWSTNCTHQLATSLGHQGYQDPRILNRTFLRSSGPNMDWFPFLIIATSISALIDQSHLFGRWTTDALLIPSDALIRPADEIGIEVFTILTSSVTSPTTKLLAKTLRRVLMMTPPDAVDSCSTNTVSLLRSCFQTYLGELSPTYNDKLASLLAQPAHDQVKRVTTLNVDSNLDELFSCRKSVF
jgi:serine/threonine protein kinase